MTDGSWGHCIKKSKSAQCARIGFQNINGLPLKNNLKSETIVQVIKDYDFDYFGMQEINTHERILPPQDQWKRKFTTHNTQAATNQHCPSQQKILYGGTAHFLNQNLSLRQIEHGQDPTNLGRWIWTLLRGKQGIQVRIISGYRPVEDTSNRPHTVYSQHEYYFNQVAQTPRHRNPRTAFFEDLNDSIMQWMAAGDQIILGLDANEDVHSRTLQEWTGEWGLIDGLQRTHPNLNRVATCNKNKNNVPIDSIWVSPGLQIITAGMTGFGELHSESDHRMLWMDIHLESLFGFNTPAPAKRPTDSLPIRDPRAMKKYNQYVKQQFKLHRIVEKTFNLESKALHHHLTDDDQQEYNQIQQIQQDIRRRAKIRCRRFYTSRPLFTKDLGVIYRKRKLWKLMEQKRLGAKVDVKAIRRLMRQVQEHTAFHLSIPEIKAKLQEVHLLWKNHKKQHLELRDTFELAIDQRRAQKFGTSVETQTKQRRNTGSARSIFTKIKNVMKPREHIAISTVEYTNEEGITVECLSRETIEQACVSEGQRRFTQASDTPFLRGSLLQSFGYKHNCFSRGPRR